MLNVWKDGFLSVALWHGSGEHDLVNNEDQRFDESAESFREWAEYAIGMRQHDYAGRRAEWEPITEPLPLKRRSIR